MSNIFVLDDDVDLVNILTNELASNGFNVSCAYDLASAYKIVAYNHIDLVITDWQLPEGLTEHFIRRCHAKYKPIILMSGFYPEEEYHLIEQGIIQAYLQKPFRLEKLEIVIKGVL